MITKSSIIQITLVVVGSLLLTTLLVFMINGTGSDSATPELQTNENGEVEDFPGPVAASDDVTNLNDEPMSKSNESNPTATFTTSAGVITLELFADMMPVTTENFITLANDGFYDGTKFHRIIDGFMIQGGDPNSKTDDTASYGTGGPGYTIEDEFVEGEKLTNQPGTIAMANTGQPNSGGSQFFINVADNSFLDFDKQPLTSRHPVFGQVVDGMDIVEALGKTPTNERDIPLEPVVVESVTISE